MTISPAVNAWFWGIIAAVIVLARFAPFFTRRWSALRVVQIAVWLGLMAWFGAHDYFQHRGARVAILTLMFLAMITAAFIWWIVRSSKAAVQREGAR